VTDERIEVPGKGTVSAVLESAPGSGWLFVYAHGAGSNLNDPFAVFLAGRLPAQGIDVLRFQFLYRELKKGMDTTPVLEAAWSAALAHARKLAADGQKVAIGGRSMGGRIASHIAAAEESVDAVALFAYPLHPPGKPAQRRDEHLPRISAPTLFCSGTRDAFGSPDELAEAAALVRDSRLHFLEGADHGFAVPKSTGRTKEGIWAEATDALVDLLNP
jgi:predicted alpha/beta-hydrolase family hydrolase